MWLVLLSMLGLLVFALSSWAMFLLRFYKLGILFMLGIFVCGFGIAQHNGKYTDIEKQQNRFAQQTCNKKGGKGVESRLSTSKVVVYTLFCKQNPEQPYTLLTKK